MLTIWPNVPERVQYLKDTLSCLRERLKALPDEIVVCSESDSTHGWAPEGLEAICAEHRTRLVFRPQDAPANLGAMLNFAYAQCRNEIVLYVQDDWRLVRPLDLSPGAEILDREVQLAMVRYYVAFTTFVGEENGWSLINNSGEYPVADNPALVHKRFLRLTGGYRENGDPGHHEIAMINDFRRSGLKAVAPKEVAENRHHFFIHIGDVSAFPSKRRS